MCKMNLVYIIWFCIFMKESKTLECYWNSCNHYQHLSSKTPYEYVRGDIRDSVLKQDGCETVSIWSLIRHGKRSPGIEFSQAIRNVIVLRDYVISKYELGKSPYCAQDVENLRNWRTDNDLFEKIHALSDEGNQEMIGIGRRLRGAFRELLERFEEGSYKIRSAYGHWIENCVSGFIEGLTGDRNETFLVEPSNATYDILAPYEACPKYLNEVKRNPLTYAEVDKYQTTAEYITMKLGLEQRIGVPFSLTHSNVTALYDICRYTSTGVKNEPSPWCSLFTENDLKIMEYIGDLRHYYRNGYGTPMNPIFGRYPMADLFKSLSDSKLGRGKKLTVYFSHATMMDMVISALGLYKDENVLTGEYRDPTRMWNSSKIAAFGANLIAALLRCTTDNTTTYKVAFYLNEDLLTPLCDSGICSWEQFEKKFRPFLNTNMDFCFT